MNHTAQNHAPAPAVVHVTSDMLTRLDVSGPRYTSYPTADRFVEAYGAAQYAQALHQRGSGGGAIAGPANPLSVYVHIPFCESVCYYCACNKIITRHHERAQPYLAALKQEIELVRQQLGPRQAVSQLHFGGGSPTFLSNDELNDLMQVLKEAFRFVLPGYNLRPLEMSGALGIEQVKATLLEHFHEYDIAGLASLLSKPLNSFYEDFTYEVKQGRDAFCRKAPVNCVCIEASASSATRSSVTRAVGAITRRASSGAWA